MKARFLPHLDSSHEHLTPLLLLFLLVLLPISATSVQMWASPTCNRWLQDKTICSKMSAASQEFWSAIQSTPMLSNRVPLLCASFLGTPAWVVRLILPGWLAWGLQRAWDPTQGVLSSICITRIFTYGFPLSFLKKWVHLNSNAGECFFSKILFVSKSDFKMKCEWVIRCQGI